VVADALIVEPARPPESIIAIVLVFDVVGGCEVDQELRVVGRQAVAGEERLNRMIKRVRLILGDTSQDGLSSRPEVGPEQSEMFHLSVMDPLVWTVSRRFGSSTPLP
jgi:hypothetical protein